MIDFTDEQKQIFKYFDGKRERLADPDAINRRLLMACSGFNEQLVLAHKGAQDNASDEDRRLALEAEEQVIAAARVAFQMPCNEEALTPEEFGATETAVRAALKAFNDFLKKKEMIAAAMPTSSPPSASGRSPSSPTTKPSSA